MDGFGGVAIRAAELIRSGKRVSPPDAWAAAAGETFPHSEWMRAKSCPKSSFLGLCEEGLITGVNPGSYTRSRENKAYAVRAAALLAREPGWAAKGPRALWDHVLGSATKEHNSQMDVVLALHGAGLLRRG